MGENGGKSSGGKLVKIVVFALLLIMFLSAVIYIFREPIWRTLAPVWDFLSDKESLRQYIESFGTLAPVVFIGLQIGQVFIAPIPGELTGLVGGYVFGWQWGMLYSTLGLTIGSMINFALGRLLGRRLVERLVPAATLSKLDDVMQRQGVLTCFFLFIMPGFPKDYLCLGLGLTPLNWRVFIFICAVGRLPGTLMLSLQGAAVYDADYWSLLWITLIAAAFLLPAYVWRNKIYALVKRLDAKKGESA